MGMERTLPTELTVQVDHLVDAPEQDAVYRDSAECAALLLVGGLLLLSPPTPRPKLPAKS
ncbi:hypothetical protein IAG44_36050 [Streptomyces roseirectus]|uniref:Uncharacterized protein n=1 Tax=Streptomyces roseirectus TaxID=2768066 RepID=A0A7H0INH6_9ACTN|nr:hypothetical protein [Streptomyces roseirectus]QNP74342.1 hypothetical protein IAG44_36050 [Streptomyces roseirectus]